MVRGIANYDPRYARALKGIPWKDINVAFGNDFEKTQEYVHEVMKKREVSVTDLLRRIDAIYNQLEVLELQHLGEKMGLLKVIGYLEIIDSELPSMLPASFRSVRAAPCSTFKS